MENSMISIEEMFRLLGMKELNIYLLSQKVEKLQVEINQLKTQIKENKNEHSKKDSSAS